MWYWEKWQHWTRSWADSSNDEIGGRHQFGSAREAVNAFVSNGALFVTYRLKRGPQVVATVLSANVWKTGQPRIVSIGGHTFTWIRPR